MSERGTIRATARPLRLAVEQIDGHTYATCSRCGRRRQVNPKRMHRDGLCADCRASDRHVWEVKGA